MLFAGISGSSTAEAAGVGGVLIPAMKKQGYDTPFAVSLIACAAVMGVIIPPSILMVVWGGVISVSIGGLFLAGVVPGRADGAVADGRRSTSTPSGAAIRSTRASRARELLKVAASRAMLPILTPGIIVGGIVGGFFTPTEASVIAVLYAMLLGVAGLPHARSAPAAPHAVRLGTLRRHRAVLHRHRVGVRLDARLFPHSAARGQRGRRPGAAASPASASSPRPRSCSSAASSTRSRRSSSSAPSSRRWPRKVGMHPIHFAHHRRDLDRLRAGDAAVRAVPDDRVLGRRHQDQGGGDGHGDPVHPVAAVLLIVILFPDLMLWLPRKLMPAFVK